MTPIETELRKLKSSLVEMWDLVLDQLVISKDVLENHDKDLASEVLANEKRVDAFELKINMDCENLLALFTPVANDLRYILAVLKITYNLERIGDYAKTIAKIVVESDKSIKKKEIVDSKVDLMFKTAGEMLSEALDAFAQENVSTARSIFKQDEDLDEVNKKANAIIARLISRKPGSINSFLNLLSIIRKLERVGDQTKNIAEEIIFYKEAEMVRHKKNLKSDK